MEIKEKDADLFEILIEELSFSGLCTSLCCDCVSQCHGAGPPPSIKKVSQETRRTF